MNLQDEINEINERIEALNKDVKSLVDELEAVMENEFPQDGDLFFFVSTFGVVLEESFRVGISGDALLEIGNMFKTKEQAEFAVEKLKVEADLRKFSRPFERGESNHYIFLDTDNDCTGVEIRCYRQTQGGIYFESEEKAQKAIESVGEERIKKYIFEEG